MKPSNLLLGDDGRVKVSKSLLLSVLDLRLSSERSRDFMDFSNIILVNCTFYRFDFLRSNIVQTFGLVLAVIVPHFISAS